MSAVADAVWGALAALPLVVHNAYLLNGLILVFIYGAAAQAWNLLGGYAGQLSFGHVAFFGVGAYTSTLLLVRAGVSPWAGMWAGALLAAAVAAVVGYPAFRLRRHYFALATLALAQMARILFLNWPLVGGAVGLYLPVRFMNAGWAMIWNTKPPYYYLALGLFAGACALAYAVDRARLGLYLRAIDLDEDAAQALGIPTLRYKQLLMAVSAAVAALAGTLFAQYVLYIDPSTVLDPSRSVLFAVMALLGGRGTVAGPALGAGFLVLLSQYAGGTLGGLGRGYDYVLYGLAIMLIALYEPRGLVGLIERVSRQLRRAGRVPSDGTEASDGGAKGPLTAGMPPRGSDALPAAVRDQPALLDVAGMRKRFGGVEALRGVDLSARRAEIVGLLGPNGAGKSTLFDCVSGFLAPSGGRVRLHTAAGDRSLVGQRPDWIAQQGLARTFQAVRLFPSLTVWQHLLVGQPHEAESLWAVFRRSAPETEQRAAELMRLTGLGSVRGLAAGALSYGQQKLLALATALMRRPLLVLLDEPVAGVNPTMIERLAAYIREENGRGTAFLIIEHNLPALMALAERLYFLADGRVIAEGPPEAIRRNDRVLAAYYGE